MEVNVKSSQRKQWQHVHVCVFLTFEKKKVFQDLEAHIE